MAVLEPTRLQEERMESITVPPLAEALATIPDFRAARGKRHGLLPLLLLVCVAMLCGARGQSGIAAWGRDYGQPWLRRLGFTRGYGPSQPTLHRLFAGVAYAAVEAALSAWAEQVMARAAPRGLEGVALDGKTLRGSKQRGAADAHLLAALSHRLGVVLGQVAVADKTNEIGAAGEFLLTLVLEGRVVTADALLTQRSLARTILDRGGDYLLAVKGNQPGLREDIALLFADPALADTVQATEEVGQHGGRVETRRLAASAALVGYSDWPGLQQALRLERRVVAKATGAVLRQETAYAVTSLAPAEATPAQLLALWRGHWAIENKLHYVRDVTFDEDRAQARAGTVPQCMAAFRNLAIGRLRLLGAANIAAACRRCAAQPARALAALGLPDDFE
jgi:predicted transposase YbfD/YdcC